MTEPAASAPAAQRLRGRTAPLPATESEELMERGIALFNAARYWHAHEAWETLWRAADEDDRDFYQGLILVAAGLLHLQRRNARGALNKLSEGLDKLSRYQPVHRGCFVNELVGKATLIRDEIRGGQLPYLIPPIIRVVDRDELAGR